MASKTRIWCMTHQLGQGMTWSFHATKAQAEAAGREALADYEDRDDVKRGDPAYPDIDTWTVEISRAGVAKALNDFIRVTCLNEH